MIEKQERRTYYKALEVFGEEAQTEMVIEEMAELTFAIQKFKRLMSSENRKATPFDLNNAVKNVQEEIADVHIVLSQLKLIFDLQEVNRIIKNKLRRLQNRMNNHPDDYNPNQIEIEF